jgi:hypothetical protein
MNYFYCTKAHIRYFVLKLLLEILYSALIVAALCALVLWAIGLPISVILDPIAISLIILLPFFFTVNGIRSFLQQWAYESESELRIRPEQGVPADLIIQKKICRELYHISTVTAVKRTWKGITVYGKTSAEYNYDPEIGRHDTEALDHIRIPPYFGNGKDIARELEKLAGTIPTV